MKPLLLLTFILALTSTVFCPHSSHASMEEIDHHLATGYRAVNTNDLETARSAFSFAAQHATRNHAADRLIEAVHGLAVSGDQGQARTLLAGLPETFSDAQDAEIQVHSAACYLLMNSTDDRAAARTLLESAWKQLPFLEKKPQILAQAGMGFAMLDDNGKAQEALARAEKALERNQNPAVRSLVADAYQALGNKHDTARVRRTSQGVPPPGWNPLAPTVAEVPTASEATQKAIRTQADRDIRAQRKAQHLLQQEDQSTSWNPFSEEYYFFPFGYWVPGSSRQLVTSRWAQHCLNRFTLIRGRYIRR